MGAPGVEALQKIEPGGNGHVGRSLKRKEDPRLITGRATYVDDMVLPGMLHAAIVRSTEAHANIVSIDSSDALGRPGIKGVYTGDDMSDLLAKNSDPSEEEVREALAGNLCRCTGYHNIVKAVMSAAGAEVTA